MDFNDLQPLDQINEPQTPSGAISISVDPETSSEQSSGYDPDGSIREVEAQLQHQEYQGGVTWKTPSIILFDLHFIVHNVKNGSLC